MGLVKVKNTLFILLGAAIFSFGLVNFTLENKLGEGGFTGITLILYFLFKWDPALMNLVLNIPMFFIGWKILGKRAFAYTIIGTVSVSVFIKVFQIVNVHIPLNDDLLLAALFAGVFLGGGLGIIFRFGGTTGGSDIIARLADKYFGWQMGKTMFLLDALVIAISALTFLDIRTTMYTLVAVFIAARVIDFVQEGMYAARGALIISDHYEEVASKITTQMERGVTYLEGEGFYTKEQRKIVYCVVSKNELFKLKSLVNSVDPYAFVSISEVHEVSGMGFTLDDERNPLHH